MEKKILDEQAMSRAITRIAYEIIEKLKGTDHLVLIGIKTRGIFLAQKIQEKIKQIEEITVPIGELDITLYRDDRHHASQAISPELKGTSIPVDITDKQVVLVDDVIYTGRTIRAAMDAIISIGRPKRIMVAALIDRGHRELPIRSDFVGKNIPTASSEEVKVKVQAYDNEEGVWLIKHKNNESREE
ncbi:bifunctional pyr operon transcriptional regulator/uracil phosphoribosyltransferase PyrR [Lacticigenium naphthae]|uniref:bifunctional pyr operon transcriptional regulator/uracil phosphoribosyltransferase PyrR n=1 Tax=Lacticigenium naphthae TaxID=515351 RepID=UPI000423D93E|nr:bifunctional pyr operon transcriptional regulator/uracil phosphoribosyltransferase PyrR [Lacticigenium naphthae]